MNKIFDKVVIASDTHLKSHIWANRPEIANDSYWAFKSVIEYCVNAKAPLILAGDVLDSNRPTSETMLFLQGELNRLLTNSIPVFWVSGNHDNVEPAWGMTIEGVQSLDKRSVTLLPNTKFYGLNYRPARELAEELEEVPPDTSVLIGHQLLDASFPQEGMHNMKMEWVPSYVKLVVLGDNHACIEYKDSRGIRFMYNGSTCMQSLAEHPDKKFTVVYLDSKGQPTFKREPCVVRKFLDFDVRSNVDLVNITQYLSDPTVLDTKGVPDDIKTPLVRVKYSPSVADVANRLYEVIGDSAHLWIQPYPTNKSPVELASIDSQEEFSPATALKALVNKEVNPDLYNFCLELLTEDPKATLNQWRDKLGVIS
jgi:DNA repair exonuclease SbcCD nuclease subunit